MKSKQRSSSLPRTLTLHYCYSTATPSLHHNALAFYWMIDSSNTEEHISTYEDTKNTLLLISKSFLPSSVPHFLRRTVRLRRDMHKICGSRFTWRILGRLGCFKQWMLPRFKWSTHWRLRLNLINKIFFIHDDYFTLYWELCMPHSVMPSRKNHYALLDSHSVHSCKNPTRAFNHQTATILEPKHV